MLDYIVVGAGSAGCVLASRLSEDPAVDVLLVEAGPPARRAEVKIPAAFGKLFQTDVDWHFTTVEQRALDGRALYWPRGRMLGGSSSMNAMMHVRGNALDYDEWAELAGDGWSYDAVLPYFKRSETDTRGPAPHRGDAGPMVISEQRSLSPLTRDFLVAAHRAGIPSVDDVNGPVQEGVAETGVTQRRGLRWSAADAYLGAARGRKNLHVATDAHVRRVLFSGDRAVGIEAEVAGHVRIARARREVVLSAGAVGSPHLLLRSGVGPADQLTDHRIAVVVDLPGVGEHLVDHYAVPVIVGIDEPTSLLAAESPRAVADLLLRRRGMLTSNVGEAHAFFRSRPDVAAADLELVFAPVPYLEHGRSLPDEHGITIGVVLLRPASRGRLWLTSPDPHDPPAIDPSYLTEPADVATLRAGVRRAFDVLAQPPLADRLADLVWPPAWPLSDDAIDEFVRTRGETLYHPVGTCRMGTDEDTVVDGELRVRGVEGLRVVDASVMPAIPRGHTHSPTVMIAERAADLVRGAAGAL